MSDHQLSKDIDLIVAKIIDHSAAMQVLLVISTRTKSQSAALGNNKNS